MRPTPNVRREGDPPARPADETARADAERAARFRRRLDEIDRSLAREFGGRIGVDTRRRLRRLAFDFAADELRAEARKTP